MNLLVEGLRLESFEEPLPAFCITLTGPGVFGGVRTDNLGTSSSMEDGIEAMLVLCECELGSLGVMGDTDGRDFGGGGGGVGDDGEGENQPRCAWLWTGIC